MMSEEHIDVVEARGTVLVVGGFRNRRMIREVPILLITALNDRISRIIGVGLAFAKRVIDLHAGKVSLNPGKTGSRVCFTLPLLSPAMLQSRT